MIVTHYFKNGKQIDYTHVKLSDNTLYYINRGVWTQTLTDSDHFKLILKADEAKYEVFE